VNSIRLSFDDGPGPSTAALLDVLHAADCKAAFFLLGSNLKLDLTTAARMIREGHAVGNHAYSHAKPGDLADAVLLQELQATDALIREAYRLAGHTIPSTIPVRLPYGLSQDDPRQLVLQKLAREHVGWTAIFDDWRDPAPEAQRLAQDMLQHVEDCAAQGKDAVLCLHDSSRHRDDRPVTVEAVRLFLSSPRYQTLLTRDASQHACV
jgi:peptidoglycan-N-acetylglucosamine deacetylase